MKLKNELCEVTVSIDPTYTFGSADNVTQYDRVLVASGLEDGDAYTTFCIRITAGEREFTIALIGGAACDDSECAILGGEILTVLQNDCITAIDLAQCSIINSKKIPKGAVNYALYRIPGGLVIYGELEIIGLDFDFNVVWRYGALDHHHQLQNS